MKHGTSVYLPGPITDAYLFELFVDRVQAFGTLFTNQDNGYILGEWKEL